MHCTIVGSGTSVTMSESDSDGVIDDFDSNRAKLVKQKLEREEFLKVYKYCPCISNYV